jgi:hypothetical protein
LGHPRNRPGKRSEGIGELVDMVQCVHERKVGRPDSRVYAVADPMDYCMTAIQRESSGVRIELASIGSEKNFIALTCTECVASAGLELGTC